jgi:hypothetical protein
MFLQDPIWPGSRQGYERIDRQGADCAVSGVSKVIDRHRILVTTLKRILWIVSRGSTCSSITQNSLALTSESTSGW